MNTQQSLCAVLEHLLHRALLQGQIESYGPRSLLYRHGCYCNDTTLWSHSPALALNHPGRYLVTVQPQQSLRLAIFSKSDFDRLLHQNWVERGSISHALNHLCRRLNLQPPLSTLDGFASYRLDPGPHYQHIIVFRPLDVLALFDIEQV